MNINTEKLLRILKELEQDVNDVCMCVESGVFIGEINGKPVKLTVMTSDEAIEAHYYARTMDENLVIEE